MNPEESFREGPFYAQITQNILLYWQMFHEWGPLFIYLYYESGVLVLILDMDLDIVDYF